MSSAYATLEEATKRLHDYGHKGPETLKGRHGAAERMVKFLPAFVANHKMPTFNLSPDSLLNGSAGGVGWINNTDLSEAVKREQEVAAMAATPTGRSYTDKACGIAPALHPAWSRPLDKAGPTPAKAGAVKRKKRRLRPWSCRGHSPASCGGSCGCAISLHALLEPGTEGTRHAHNPEETAAGDRCAPSARGRARAGPAGSSSRSQDGTGRQPIPKASTSRLKFS